MGKMNARIEIVDALFKQWLQKNPSTTLLIKNKIKCGKIIHLKVLYRDVLYGI